MAKEEDTFTARVYDGRVSIPKLIRDRYEVVGGDEVVLMFVKKVER